MHVCVDPSLRSRGDEMATLGLASDVLAGASLAFAVGGIVAAVLPPQSEVRSRVALRVGPASLALIGSF